MDVFGQILHFTPLFIADLVEILPNMQFSSHITVYQAHFKQVLPGFQLDPSCLTIDKVKHQLCPNSAPFCHPDRLSTIRPRSSSIQGI
jgi:hypothetical protein